MANTMKESAAQTVRSASRVVEICSEVDGSRPAVSAEQPKKTAIAVPAVQPSLAIFFGDETKLLAPPVAPNGSVVELAEFLREKVQKVANNQEVDDVGSATRRGHGTADVQKRLIMVVSSMLQRVQEMRTLFAMAASKDTRLGEELALRGTASEKEAASAQRGATTTQAKSGIASGGVDIGGVVGGTVLSMTPLRALGQPLQQVASGVARVVKESGNLGSAAGAERSAMLQADAHTFQALSSTATTTAQREDAAVQNIDGTISRFFALLDKVGELSYSTSKSIIDHF
ncbi:MAG: hypothetical protein LBP65_00160 [Puniceicoccales bacterium]|jgi:hypothetical protein|nr:hypothetical protein [Puniceicoccales bacterium]